MADRVVPARITLALDACGLDGPAVDLACGTWEGNPDGDVDAWELGTAEPSAEQVEMLAALTSLPVAYFYQPITPGPQLDGVIVCQRRPRRCERVEANVVDERGVLHYGGQPPRTPPAAAQGALF